MTPTARQSYLKALGHCPNSIPGRALMRGEWDHSIGMAPHIEEAERLRNLPENRDGE